MDLELQGRTDVVIGGSSGTVVKTATTTKLKAVLVIRAASSVERDHQQCARPPAACGLGGVRTPESPHVHVVSGNPPAPLVSALGRSVDADAEGVSPEPFAGRVDGAAEDAGLHFEADPLGPRVVALFDVGERQASRWCPSHLGRVATPASSRSTSSSLLYGASPARTAPASPRPKRRDASMA